MSGRLPTHLLVGALLRRVNDAGGMAMVRARGDAQAGAVLVLLDGEDRAVERGLGPDGAVTLIEARKSAADATIDDYWRRRRARDPDLWVVELTIDDGEQLAREALIDG